MSCKKVIFRVDSSIQIGSGHVMRCLTLANMLKEYGYKCNFVCRDLVGNSIDIIKKNHFDVKVLPKPDHSIKVEDKKKINIHEHWLEVPWTNDLKQTKKFLDDNKFDLIIIDHYAIDIRWEKGIITEISKIMVIDDIPDRKHLCNILLDQNLGRKPKDYQNLVPIECKLLLGTDFALLRPEFKQLRKMSIEKRRSSKIENILISLGGIDKDNYTCKVLEALKKSNIPKSIKITVIMGKNAPWVKKVQELAKELFFLQKVYVDATNMAEIMFDADLAIGAAGSSSWERCCMGLPSLTLILARNQKDIAYSLQNHNISKVIKEENFEKKLGYEVNLLIKNPSYLKKMSTASSYICDGEGPKKLVNEINEVMSR